MSNRAPFDFYETPPWQTQALLRRVQISGRVLECCVGDRSIANVLKDCNVISNDINPAHKAEFHLDATLQESWEVFPEVDWVVTNPPFNCALPILQLAHQHSRYGVAFLLRLSFLEPTKLRSPWLSKHPPTRQIILPRWSYKQNGSTDSVTTAWFVWHRNFCPIEVVGLEEKRSEYAIKFF